MGKFLIFNRIKLKFYWTGIFFIIYTQLVLPGGWPPQTPIPAFVAGRSNAVLPYISNFLNYIFCESSVFLFLYIYFTSAQHFYLAITTKRTARTVYMYIETATSWVCAVRMAVCFVCCFSCMNSFFFHLQSCRPRQISCWCGPAISPRANKLQTEAARIVTGLTHSVSIANLYRECGWQIQCVESRRKAQKYFLCTKLHTIWSFLI